MRQHFFILGETTGKAVFPPFPGRYALRAVRRYHQRKAESSRITCSRTGSAASRMSAALRKS